MLELGDLIIVPLTLDELIMRRDNPDKFAEKYNLNEVPEKLDTHMIRVYNLKELRIKQDPDAWIYHTYFLILSKKYSALVGTLGLQGKPDADQYVEIGYFMDSKYFNQGIMSEALRIVSDYLLLKEDIKGILAFTKVDNYASHSVLRKCGYFEKYNEKDMILWERTL